MKMLNLSKIVKCQKYTGVVCMNFWKYIKKEPGNLFHDNRGNITLFMPSKKHSNYCISREFQISTTIFSEESLVEANENETNPAIDPRKDRTKVIPVEVSIRYMKSAAYKETYGDEPVWVKYRRNFKGQFIPKITRKRCIRAGVVATGSPCPICRDEYLVLDYRNVDLLKQFISPYTGNVYDLKKIHLCQLKLLELEVALRKAKLYGYITYDVPFRKYDYEDYYSNLKK